MRRFMKALFVAPLPPPMTGNSLPVKILYEELKSDSNNDIEVINLSKSTHRAGVDSLSRVSKILGVLRRVWAKQKRNDIVYLSIAESFAGNSRDIVIYLICRARLNSLIIHMLGGAGMNNILGKKAGLQYRINRFFLSRLGGIIVEGKTQCDMFSRVADPNKIHIVPNFAEEFLFVPEDEVRRNFEDIEQLRILFLSNMLYGKGHIELLEAYLQLDPMLRECVVVDFAGKFVSEGDKQHFLDKMKGVENVKYHGSVSGVDKKNLYSRAHVFCLPTYYPYEGQPFCIIEAYATGCAVITTNHSGIGNVFRDEHNGFEVEKRSVESLVSAIERAVHQKDVLRSIAISNVKLAKQNHTQSAYISSMKAVFDSVSSA